MIKHKQTRKYALNCLLIISIVFASLLQANAVVVPACPYNENFTSFADNATTFTSNGVSFSVSTLINSTIHVNKFAGGWSGANDNDYLDNADANQANLGASFKISSATAFQLRRFYLFLSDVGQANLGTNGTVSIVGKNGGTTVFNVSVTSSTWNNNFSFQNGFNLIDMAYFGGQDNTFASITEFTITTSSNSKMDYVALDGMQWIANSFSTAPTIAASAATSITNTGATLNGTVTANNLSTNDSIQYSTSSTLASNVKTIVASPATSTGASSTSISKSITGLSAGITYYFRVKASNCNGNKYSSILSFTTTGGATITNSGSLSVFNTCSGVASSSESFTVSGTDLTANLVATAPTGYEVSLTSVTGFASSVNVVPTSGAVSNKTVYVRLASSATGTPSGNIVLSSTGATDKILAVSGTVNYSDPITWLTSDPICGEGTVLFYESARLASPPISQHKLYDAATNGNVVGEGLTTPIISQTTDFWVTYTSFNGCESIREKVTATVNAIPSAPFVATPSVICNEGSVTLSAQNAVRLNCRNCGDNNNYLWKNSAGDSVFNDADFTTPLLTKTETYTVTAELNGCISSPSSVVVEVLNIPTPTISTLVPVCSGNSTVINVIPFSNGRIAECRGCGELFDYTWYNTNGDSVGNGSSFNTQTLLFNTKFYVKASDNGCYSDTAGINVYVKDKPEIFQELIDLKICNGSIAKYKVASEGENLNYNWGMTNGVNWMIQPSETKDSVEFNVDAELNGATIFTIVSNTCGKDTSMAMLYVNVVDTAVSVQNGTITANIADQTYQWINVDTKTNIDGETNRTYLPTKTGTYAVVITQSFGKGRYCTDTSGYRYVEVVATGLENSIVSNFSIYPNPATDNVTVTFTESVSGSVSIVDLHGNVVATKSISGTTSNISTAELASGVYVVKISSDKGVAVKQLIVK